MRCVDGPSVRQLLERDQRLSIVDAARFVFNVAATTDIYTLSDTLSLHDALPISMRYVSGPSLQSLIRERGMLSTGDRSEEHTSELQSPLNISYAVFCLKKKN